MQWTRMKEAHSTGIILGHELRIIGKTSFWAMMDRFANVKFVRGIVVDGLNIQPEILVGWRYLKDWGVLPPTFPYPNNVKKGYKVRGVRDGKGDREVDMDRQLERIKKDLMTEFKDVFKVKLEKTDRINAPPVKIMIDQDRMEKEKPRQATVPIPIPAHLRQAANSKLDDMLEAGFVKPCHHKTVFASRGFFREKKSGDSKKLKAGLVYL